MNCKSSFKENRIADTRGTAFPGKIPYIDLIESAAMFLVILYHASFCRFMFLEDPGAESLINYYLRSFLACGVPLFLIVHGYLMFRRDLDLKKHLLKTLRYALLALFWGVITQGVFYLIWGTPFEIKAFLEDMFTWRDGTIHLWYLGALVIIYLAFPVLKYLHDHNRKLFCYVIAVLALMSFGNKIIAYGGAILTGLLGKHQTWMVYSNWFTMFNPVPDIPAFTIVYFCLGAYLQEFLDWAGKLRRINLLATAGALAGAAMHTLCFLLLWKVLGYYYCPAWYGYETVSGLLMTVCLVVLCANYKGKRGWKLFRLISVNTLGIYFLHLGKIPYHILLRFNVKELIPTLYNLPGNMLLAAAVLGACLIITMIMKRIPLLRRLVS